MIRPIVTDIFFLGQKSLPATRDDIQIARDLQDTLAAHRAGCVGMAANMIGFRKNIIIVSMGPADVVMTGAAGAKLNGASMGSMDMVMFNPMIVKKSGTYETEEGCLSLTGTRRTTRYQKITVRYQDMDFRSRTQEFSGWTAQIIQHECDHLAGIVI